MMDLCHVFPKIHTSIFTIQLHTRPIPPLHTSLHFIYYSSMVGLFWVKSQRSYYELIPSIHVCMYTRACVCVHTSIQFSMHTLHHELVVPSISP